MNKLCFMKNLLHCPYFSQFTEYHENFNVNQDLATARCRKNPAPQQLSSNLDSATNQLPVLNKTLSLSGSLQELMKN